MDGGVSAIISLAKFGWTIYNYGFSEANSPDRIYSQFGRELGNVAQYIELVAEVYPHALEAAYDDQSLDSRGTGTPGDRIKRLVEDEIHELRLVFDECQRQLRRPDRFDTRGTNFIKRIIWNADTRSLVEELRVRLSRQRQAVADVLNTLNAQLQVNATRNDSRFDSDKVQRELKAIEVPSFLAFQFSLSLPSGPALILNGQYETTNEIWLRAIRAHLSHSTIQITPDGIQTPQRFANLMKAHWMLRQLREHHTLEYGGKTSPIDQRVHRLELRVYGQLTRPDLVEHFEDSIGSLGSSALTLWKEVFEEAPPSTTSPDDLLQLELRAPPEYQRLQLIVRRYGNDGKAVQLIRNKIRHNTRSLFPDEPQIIDQDNAIILPVFAIPDSNESRLTVDVRRKGERAGFEYKFSKIEHVYQLLWTLTNHKVAKEAENVSVHLGKTVHKGRVEIWLYDPEPYEPDYDIDGGEGLATQTEQDRCSLATSRASTVGTLIIDRKAPSLAPSNKSTRTVSSSATMVAATPTNKPLFIVYFKRGIRFSYMCLKLRSYIFVDESSCDCSDPRKRCHRLIIRSSSKELEVMLSRPPKSDGRDSDMLQSLGLFARASVQEREQDISAKEHRFFTTEKHRSLTLEFRKVEELVEFRKALRLALAFAKEPETTHSLMAKRAKHFENRPRLGSLRERMISPDISPTSPRMMFSGSSRASSSRTLSIASAPELYEMSTDGAFQSGRLSPSDDFSRSPLSLNSFVSHTLERDDRSQTSIGDVGGSTTTNFRSEFYSLPVRTSSFQSPTSRAEITHTHFQQQNNRDLSDFGIYELPANGIHSLPKNGISELPGESSRGRHNLSSFSLATNKLGEVITQGPVNDTTGGRIVRTDGYGASIVTLTPPPSVDLQDVTNSADCSQCARCLFYRLPCAPLNSSLGRKRCCYQCYWGNRQAPEEIRCFVPCTSLESSQDHISLLHEQRSIYESAKYDCTKDDGTFNSKALLRLRCETFGALDSDMSDCCNCQKLVAPLSDDRFDEADICVPESVRRTNLDLKGKGRCMT